VYEEGFAAVDAGIAMVALVLGKGRRERALPFGRTTAVALDRYLRVRARHKHAAFHGCGWGSRAG
jgi:site-specific recombinase XerC